MTQIMIAVVIVVAGMAVVAVSYVFSAKLLKKREEGLDNLKEILDKREALIEASEKNVKEYAEATEKLMRLLNEKNEQLTQLQKDLFAWADNLEKYQNAVDKNWERYVSRQKPLEIGADLTEAPDWFEHRGANVIFEKDGTFKVVDKGSIET